MLSSGGYDFENQTLCIGISISPYVMHIASSLYVRGFVYPYKNTYPKNVVAAASP